MQEEQREAAARAAEERKRVQDEQREAAARAAEERREAAAEAATQKKAATEEKRRAVERAAQERRDAAAAKSASAAASKPPPSIPKISIPSPTLSLFGSGSKEVVEVEPSKTKPPTKKPKAKPAPAGVPTINGWREAPNGGIEGRITGSPNFRENEKVETSPIAKGNIQEFSVVTTGSGSKYFLGDAKSAGGGSEGGGLLDGLFGGRVSPQIVPAPAPAPKSTRMPKAPLPQFDNSAADALKERLAKAAEEREAKQLAKEEKRAEMERAKKAKRAELDRKREEATKIAEERRQASAQAAEEKRQRVAAQNAAVTASKLKKAAPQKAAPSSPTFQLFPSKSSEETKAPPSKGDLPTINSWKVASDGGISGKITGSDDFRDGEKISTSPIATRGSFKDGMTVVTTSGSKYRLGSEAVASEGRVFGGFFGGGGGVGGSSTKAIVVEKKGKGEDVARQREEKRLAMAKAAEERRAEAENKKQEALAKRQAEAEMRRSEATIAKQEAAAAKAEKLKAEKAKVAAAKAAAAEERRIAAAEVAAQRKTAVEEKKRAAEQGRKDAAAAKAAAAKASKAKVAKKVERTKSSGTISLFGVGAKEAPAKAAAPAKVKGGAIGIINGWKIAIDGGVTGRIIGSSQFRDNEKVTTSPLATKGGEAQRVAKRQAKRTRL